MLTQCSLTNTQFFPSVQVPPCELRTLRTLDFFPRAVKKKVPPNRLTIYGGGARSARGASATSRDAGQHPRRRAEGQMKRALGATAAHPRPTRRQSPMHGMAIGDENRRISPIDGVSSPRCATVRSGICGACLPDTPAVRPQADERRAGQGDVALWRQCGDRPQKDLHFHSDSASFLRYIRRVTMWGQTFAKMSGMLDLSRDEKAACLLQSA